MVCQGAPLRDSSSLSLPERYSLRLGAKTAALSDSAAPFFRPLTGQGETDREISR